MKYNILLADPAWSYRDKASAGKRGAGHKYPTMKLAELAGLRPQIDAMAAKDCAIFMWATAPLISDGLQLMSAWGFKYRTWAFVWVKTNRLPRQTLWKDIEIGSTFVGMGHWTRSNAEVVLLGTRGRPLRQARNVRQVILAPRARHSEKPAETRERIVALMGDVPRIELFARQRAPGWDAVGLDVGVTFDQVALELGKRTEEERAA